MEDVDTGDENRLWEEAEAKRRAEFAKKIKEEAETSAKIRAEEDRLWEEAWAKKKAEVEKRISEEAEASTNQSADEKKRLEREADDKRRVEEEKRLKEEARAKRRAEEEKRLKEKAEAKRRVEEEDRLKKAAASKRNSEEEAEAKRRVIGEKRIKEEAEKAAERRAGEEKRLKEEVETKRIVEAANRQKLMAESNTETEKVQEGTNSGIKKRVLVGSGVAVLAVIGIWFFSVFNTGSEEHSPPGPKIEATAVEDPIILEKNEVDSQQTEESFLNLAVGDTYEGGIIFEIDPSGKTGKIVHIDDAGPMSWQNALNIHEQFGEGWRLPTFDELQIMYRNIGQGATNRGEFSDGLYWSATDYDEYQARLLRFRDGNTSYHYNKNVEHRKFRVRAIRDFSR